MLTLVLGWVLSEFGARRGAQLEARRRIHDVKLEAYARWTSAMEALMRTWAWKKPVRAPELGILQKKLELLETDPETRRLLHEIRETLPQEGSKDYDFMHLASHSSPYFDWKPFREKMDQLMDRVRSSKPD